MYSSGINFKTEGPKIFPVCETPELSVIISGAGNVSNMTLAVEQITESLTVSSRWNLKKVRAVITDVLVDIHAKHVTPVPVQDKPTFDFLIGVWSPSEGTAMLETSWSTVNRVRFPGRRFIGGGSESAEMAGALIRSKVSSVEAAKVVASFCIDAAKRFSRDCGGQTRIWTLTQDGKVRRCRTSEVSELRKYSELVFGTVGEFLEVLDIGSYSTSAIDSAMGIMKIRAMELGAIRESFGSTSKPEGPLNPQHPTAAPLDPPPSQE
jgi:hypothetical protein